MARRRFGVPGQHELRGHDGEEGRRLRSAMIALYATPTLDEVAEEVERTLVAIMAEVARGAGG
jgi:hypothetical protein